MNPPFDVIIIGQGLAGSLLAHALLKKNQNVLVIDDDHHSSSSIVAAGLINPVTGFRPNVTEHFDTYLLSAQNMYGDLEKHFQGNFLFSYPQIRIYDSTEQAQKWKEAQNTFVTDFVPATKQHPFGACLVTQSYVVNTTLILQKTKEMLQIQNRLRHMKIDYADIKLQKDAILFQNFVAKKIVFCEGYKVLFNPFFSHLTMNPAKGELLTLQLNDLDPKIYNWGKWLVPKPNQTFILGSSFDRETLDERPTSKGKNDLLSAFKKVLPTQEVEILSHKAGVRPATLSRKPFVEAHPEHKNMYCFNGFGSKGCLMMPYYIEKLTSHIIDNTPMEVL
ncbi:MAG: FAD-binding oxidoreductase [Bdellovibrionales bacterium]|nr:FAD-binding oxidoreductase [Bdellovibrionales bacterium]